MKRSFSIYCSVNTVNTIGIVISVLVFSFSYDISAQKAPEWPCFHGADRTNKSMETGLLKEWPAEGPGLKWTVSGLGEGYSAVSVGGGLIYASGKESGQTYIFCFNPEGKLVWKKPNGQAWSTALSYAASYTGARSTPTYDKGILYQLGESGRLAAFDAKTGAEKWKCDIAKDFEAEIPTYGYSESVLVEGDMLYVRPFGKKGYQVCLNKKSGDLIWANTEISGKPGYSSMIFNDYGGVHQLIGSVGNFYYSIDAKTGKMLWKIGFANQRELNISDAVVSGEYVFVSSGYGKGSLMSRLKKSDKTFGAETVWESGLMDNHHGGVIFHNGYLYGSGDKARGWYCLDFMTGRQIWKIPNGKGSVTYADGMLYLLDERGTITLVKASPEDAGQKGEFTVPKGGDGMFWAHPVICDGTLYIRHADKLYAYDVKRH